MRGTCLALGCLLTGIGASARADGGAACGAITIKGCCQGSLLHYCASGQLKQQDCGATPSCGWDPSLSYYACGTAGGDDPSGKHPHACPGLADAGARDLPSMVLDLPVLPVEDAAGPDGASRTEAGTDLGTPGEPSGGQGEASACGCRVARVPSLVPWVLFALLVPLGWRGWPRR